MNETLEQLSKIVSSDEYDIQAGETVKRLQEKWDLANAAEKLGEHIVIQQLVEDAEKQVEYIQGILKDQIVKDQEDINFRFKLQGECMGYQMIIDLFTGARTQQVDQEINAAKARADAQER